MSSRSFREKGLRADGKWVMFLRVFALTAVIVIVAIVINAASRPSEKPASETAASTVETATTETTTVEQTSSESTAATTAAPGPVAPTDADMEPLIIKKYLTVNPYSRVGTRRSTTEKIVIHYVANPNTTAEQNWNYFNGLARSHATSASSNFIIGLDGEIIQCMPIYEIAYANSPINETSVSIECCHPTSDGHLTEATYNSLVKLVSWLANRYEMDRDDVIRHFDVTGKLCPLYWAGDRGSDGYERWEAFRNDIIFNK